MAVIENSVMINRSLGEVFDYLVDLRNELEWNPDVRSMKKAYRWACSNGGALAVVFDVTLTSQGSGCRLFSRFDARPHSLLRLCFPIVRRQWERAEQQYMQPIKNALEKASTGNSGAQSISGS